MYFTKQVQHVDTDPNQEIPDSSQDEKLLEQKVIEGQDECLSHCENVNVFIFLRNGIIIFAR